MGWNWKSAFDWRKPGPTKERLVLGGVGLILVIGVLGALGGGTSTPDSAEAPAKSPNAHTPSAHTPITDTPIANSARTVKPPASESRSRPMPATSNLPKRPVLQDRQGRAFAYSVPAGWQVTETSNGVDIAAPDGVTGVSASILVGGFGQPTPRQYLVQILRATGQTDARFVSIKTIPPRPGPMGLQWRGIQAEIVSAQRGRPIHIQATSQVLQGAGQYVAIVTGAQGPIARWPTLRTWLPHVRDSIRITNGALITGSMRNALPRGIDADDIYGDYNRAWEARQLPEDQISQARREATMGYSRQMDPDTDKIWDMPLEDYDPTVQGYRNPDHPHQVLVPACKPMSPSCY